MENSVLTSKQICAIPINAPDDLAKKFEIVADTAYIYHFMAGGGVSYYNCGAKTTKINIGTFNSYIFYLYDYIFTQKVPISVLR